MDDLLSGMWATAAGDPATLDRLTVTGDRQGLPSLYEVTRLATSSIAAAALGVSEVLAARTGDPAPRVAVDTRAACAAFRSENLLTPIGCELPPIWDLVAGDYQAADGWNRLHTHYRSHRLAVLAVLELPEDGRHTATFR